MRDRRRRQGLALLADSAGPLLILFEERPDHCILASANV